MMADRSLELIMRHERSGSVKWQKKSPSLRQQTTDSSTNLTNSISERTHNENI